MNISNKILHMRIIYDNVTLMQKEKGRLD